MYSSPLQIKGKRSIAAYGHMLEGASVGFSGLGCMIRYPPHRSGPSTISRAIVVFNISFQPHDWPADGVSEAGWRTSIKNRSVILSSPSIQISFLPTLKDLHVRHCSASTVFEHTDPHVDVSFGQGRWQGRPYRGYRGE